MAKHTNLLGRRFGRLVAIKLATIDDKYRVRWHCCCDCGNRHTVAAGHLMRGLINSCGCIRKETTRERGKANTRHGHAAFNKNTREYGSWRSMHERCSNPKHQAYARYGGCGIKVCERWLQFENFLTDMGPRPEGHTLDRWPDPYGDYEPGNCRWATPKEQRANHRSRVRQ